ncbi:MAG: 3-oxoacyl-[acyl-carrier protein] reductase [uncultured Chloroflexi bacterium]|uniref:3-oxoacyl-[acyl-carrier protein] reductase n=1 Tax=uncultured Chloroflexota bacterium TaxID=166587 RepID=A0A6J4K2X4_9CHLR|nr:MAG: 3-oxoacyl-[acyl-carrier protein] reductase [uncultured Chloroflexota bacterium]
MRMQGKVAIVSGGGGAGIGRAIAELYAREGAAVVVGDQNKEGAEAVAGKIEEGGGRALALHAYASAADDVQRLVQAAVDTFGKLTTVVNVASWSAVKPVHEMSEAEWERTLDVGLKSCFLTAHYGLPEMMKLGRSGGCSIVSISSANGVITNPNFGAYSAAKAGILGFTRSLAMDYGPHGIRANAICPGLILNDRSRPKVQADEAEWRGNVDCYPLGEIGTPEDVAHGALYLASDEAKWVTGITLMVDGGLTIQSVEALVRPSFRRRWKTGTVTLSDD